MDKFSIVRDDMHKAIILRLNESFKLSEDYTGDIIKGQFHGLTEPYHFIVDFRALKPSVGDLASIASATARGENPLLQNENVNRIFILSNNSMVRLAAKGMNYPIFGNVKVTVCETLEEVFAELSN